MTAKDMWDAYANNNSINEEYDAWAFGDDPDLLARLVLDGVKTATASAHSFYELEGEELPKEGAYSVILNSREEAVCIIRTTRVFVTRFCDVDDRQAWKEGEGERSLSYWRTVHERFFREELEQIGIPFDENMKVVCEEFIRVYP